MRKADYNLKVGREDKVTNYPLSLMLLSSSSLPSPTLGISRKRKLIQFLKKKSHIGNNTMEEEPKTFDTINDQKPPVIYRCKKCRKIVASEENVVAHKPGKGEECFKWKKRSGQQSIPECSSIFVEPLKWMQPVHDGHVEEKLHCISCKARLGSFNWAGMQCSCGAWVNPAFQLHKGRVDECHI